MHTQTMLLSSLNSTLPKFPEGESNTNVLDVIGKAISEANLNVNGALFSPFLIKVANANPSKKDQQIGSWSQIWASERGDTPIQFFQYTPGPYDEKRFLPLGDIAILNGLTPDSFGGMVFANPSSDPANAVLAHPTGFTWVLDDHDSGNSRDLHYWWPIAPEGYTAVGLCFTNSSAQPDPSHYWCVKNEYVTNASPAVFWSDKGSHWSHNGSLTNATLPASTSISKQIALAPTTVCSAEAGQAPAFLTVDQCIIKTSLPAPDPVYDPSSHSGSSTALGVADIAVVPYTGIADPGYSQQSLNSPFYYVANESAWLCLGSYPSSEGGVYKMDMVVGSSQTDSSSFNNATSLTVGAEVGIEFEGLSSKISTSYTETFSYEVSKDDTQYSEVTVSVEMHFPVADRVWLWQKYGVLTMFRDSLTSPQGAAVSYSFSDYTIVKSPAE